MKFIREDNPKRIWELDFFRGIALIIMIYFHMVYDLVELYGFKINYGSGILYYLGKFAVILFMIIAGISSTLSRNNLKRGAQLLILAIVITIVTHLVDAKLGIKFGILHFMGISMVLYNLLIKLSNKILVIIAIAIIIIGNYFTNIVAPNDYFFVFNITSNKFYSSDYYPLLPWMGAYIFGIVIGKKYYSNRKSLIKWRMKDNLLLMAGRNSLLVYLTHQPLMLAFLYIIFKII